MASNRFQTRFQRAMADVSQVFARPRQVLDDRELNAAQKRELLKHWEYDLRTMQVATEENMPGPETGVSETLREVRACLLTLGDAHAPERSASHKQGG